jgi:hypothetical protein
VDVYAIVGVAVSGKGVSVTGIVGEAVTDGGAVTVGNRGVYEGARVFVSGGGRAGVPEQPASRRAVTRKAKTLAFFTVAPPRSIPAYSVQANTVGKPL